MATVIYGQGVSEIRGSIGGTTFSQGPYGKVMKNKSNPNVINTFSSIIAKANFKSLAHLWSSVLTGAQRTAWDNASANFPHQNSLGQTIFLSGYALFQEFNGNLLLIEEPIILDPPTPTYVIPPTDLIISANVATNEVMREIIPNPVDNSISYVLFATAPYRSGIANANNLFRFAGHTLTGGGANINFFNEYTFKFGSLVAGMSASAYVFSIQKATGLTSGRIQRTITITDILIITIDWMNMGAIVNLSDTITDTTSGATGLVTGIITGSQFTMQVISGTFSLADWFTSSGGGTNGIITGIS